ncbi:MAG: hypothetical protein L6Q54_06585 [Leptospiraceae bacterium]|nr:hypothetical protein [Leptospiraceae bacterium]MCK6380903.1 hypothetical protein [Leptospiraceae bacterium]NUM40041.1 hypothetical protein [Leptospiraceae bacterium]
MRTTLLFLAISIGIFAQDKQNATVNEKKDQPSNSTENNQPKEQKKDSDQATVMDKEYYEYYFTTLPDSAKLKKEKLEFNLIKTFKTEINKRDYPACKDLLPQITAKSVQYEKVTPESIWVRGIKDVLGYLPYKEYMYIIKFQKYLAYISYETDPSKYVQAPFQMELIFKKDNIFDSKTESHPTETK